MRSFKVYAHPSRGMEAVKDGFSWAAFFCGFPWLLFKKLWRCAGICVLIFMMAKWIELSVWGSADDGTKVVVSLIVSAVTIVLYLLPAFRGNRWLERALSKRGYEYLRTVECETAKGAVAIAQRFPNERAHRPGLSERRFT